MLKVLFPWKQNNTKKVLDAMEQVVNEAASLPIEEVVPPEELPLLPCHVCNRTFLPQPLKKHIPICEQAARKKRKPFDSLKQRVEGTDMAPFYQKSYLKKTTPETVTLPHVGDAYGNNKQSKWREKHFELQNTIKNAKDTKTEMTTHNPHTPTTPNVRKTGHLTVNQNSTNERCPICDRSFGPKAFDRHVEFCKEQRNRVPVHKSPAVVQQAKERLEARINYRVPPLRQSKRNLVRDKYSPSSQGSLLLRSNSLISGKSTTSISSSGSNMLPGRKITPKSNEKIHQRNAKNYNKKESRSRTRLDKLIGDCGDTKETNKIESNVSKSFHTKRTVPAKKINRTEVNDSVQDITVSSLCVEKDKKLVTWKDTVKTKVTTSISLTTANRGSKTTEDYTTSEEESSISTEINKVPSLGKLLKSRIEKLNKYKSNDLNKEKDSKSLENTQIEEQFGSDSKNFSEELSSLAHISEEGEIEDLSPKTQIIESKFISEEKTENKFNKIQSEEKIFNNEEIFSNRHSISSDFSFEKDYESSKEKNEDSGEETTKTEDTSSLCLRLPLEGMESKVKLKNNDLDPEEKLKNNIKGFYEIMKTRRNKKEQLCLLESSKEIFSHLDLTSRITSDSSCCPNEQKYENTRDMVSKLETEELLSKNDCVGNERNTGCFELKEELTKASEKRMRMWKRRKKVTKCRMCYRCYENKLKKSKWNNLQSKVNKANNFDLFNADNSEFESVLDSLQEESVSADNLLKTPKVDIIALRRSKSVDDITSKQPIENERKNIFSRSLPNVNFTENTNDQKSFVHKLSTNNSFDNVIPKKRRKLSPSCLNKGEIQKNLEENITMIRMRKNQDPPLPLILDYNRTQPYNFVTNVLYINEVFTSFITPEKSEIEGSMNEFEDDGIQELGDEVLEEWEAVEEELRKEQERKKSLVNYESTIQSSKSSNNSIGKEKSRTATEKTEKAESNESLNTLKNSSTSIIENIIKENTEENEENFVPNIKNTQEKVQSIIVETKINSIAKKTNEKTEADHNMFLPNIENIEEKFPNIPTTFFETKISSLTNITNEKTEENEEISLPKIENAKETFSNVPTTIFETKMCSEKIPCRLPRIIAKNKYSTPLKRLKESTEEHLKLPVIENLVSSKDACVEVALPSDKLVQVPSRNAEESVSFCQQTSKIMVDECSSFNMADTERIQKESQETAGRNLGFEESLGGMLEKGGDAEEVNNKTYDINSTPTAEELYPDNPEMYEEFKKYEEMYRKQREGRTSSSRKQRKKITDFGINIEHINKSYGDSAYGSLNRKQDSDKADSSNETSHLMVSNNGCEKLPKYCHECGNKYPVSTAKFCVECGVKRLIL